MTSTLPPMITPEEVQEALGGPSKISLKTIRRRAKDGTFPGVKWIGQKLFFQRAVIAAFLEGNPQPER